MTATPPPIWHSAAEVEAAFKDRLAAAEAIRQRILAAPGPRTLENTLTPFNDMLVETDRALPLGDLMANVHPDAGVREAAEKGVQLGRKFINDIRLDPGLYQALSAVPEEGLEPEAKRFRSRLLRDYRRSGVDRDEATRRRLAALYEGMVAAGQAFSRNIREDRRSVELNTAEDLAGLPPDFVARHQPAPDGKIRVTTDYSDIFPFLTYSPREDLRRALYFKFDQRGHPANEKPLKELLDLRHESATLLGYRNWADYSAEDKMVKTEKVIADYIEDVARTTRPRMEADVARLLARKRQDDPGADAIHEWDRMYYAQKVRTEDFGVDSREVRSYFEFHDVKEGILALAQELFGVSFARVEDGEVWHEGVEAYDVHDAGAAKRPIGPLVDSSLRWNDTHVQDAGAARFVGRFYLDLHPRKDKYSHAAVFHTQTGLEGRQPGVIGLVANFNGPGSPAESALLEHGEVLTFLHEFGHLMHHLLSGRHRWITVSGFTTEWDFVETPSQLLEEWAWDAGVLARFARHYQTGQPMPEDLVDRMVKAEEFGKGLDIMRQVFYATLSLTYHNQDPANLDLLGVLKEVKRAFSPYPYEEGTYTYASFGHLDEYASMYYTYLWSRAIEKDIFTVFQANGLMDRKTARAYRETILEPGGAVDAADMVRHFLGRDYSFEAFKKWLTS